MTRPSVRSEHLETLQRLFRRRPVAQLEQMERALRLSARTVFRALSQLGYLSSYSHAGRYYTLEKIPSFDAHGLWFHGDVRFSSHGTLRATVVVLVKHAPAGQTHEELQGLLGLRVHDTLRSLVGSREIARQLFEDLYIYLHPDSRVAAAQMACRGQGRELSAAPPAKGPLDLARVIDVLVAAIRTRRVEAGGVARRLRTQGLEVSEEQVQAVFATYGLKKRPRSRSRRSRR